MERMIEVTLISPAKVNGKRKPVGAKVSVTKEVRNQLATSGAVVKLPDLDAQLEQEISEFEMAVQEKAEEIVGSAVEEAVNQLVDDLEAAEKRAKAATERADLLENGRSEVEAEREKLLNRAIMAERKAEVLEQQFAARKTSDVPQAASDTSDKKSAPTKAAEKKTGAKPAAKGKAT
jgi:hypothetical protein